MQAHMKLNISIIAIIKERQAFFGKELPKQSKNEEPQKDLQYHQQKFKFIPKFMQEMKQITLVSQELRYSLVVVR